MFYVSITPLHQCSPPAFSRLSGHPHLKQQAYPHGTSSEQKMSASIYFFDYIPRLGNSMLTCSLKCIYVLDLHKEMHIFTHK